jgi:hypothetical protein
MVDGVRPSYLTPFILKGSLVSCGNVPTELSQCLRFTANVMSKI